MNNTVEDKEKIDLFLSLFRDLENKLVMIANLDYEDYVSYSRALNHIHSLELDPIIAVDETDIHRINVSIRTSQCHDNCSRTCTVRIA